MGSLILSQNLEQSHSKTEGPRCFEMPLQLCMVSNVLHTKKIVTKHPRLNIQLMVRWKSQIRMTAGPPLPHCSKRALCPQVLVNKMRRWEMTQGLTIGGDGLLSNYPAFAVCQVSLKASKVQSWNIFSPTASLRPRRCSAFFNFLFTWYCKIQGPSWNSLFRRTTPSKMYDVLSKWRTEGGVEKSNSFKFVLLSNMTFMDFHASLNVYQNLLWFLSCCST